MGRLSGLNRATVDGIPIGRFVLRIAWVTLRLVAVAYIGHSGEKFFYQGF